MADSLLLISQRVIPSKLEDSGYQFLQPGLENALKEVLQK
jgi:NAD dependent epimerase/dehydratase family enzyme